MVSHKIGFGYSGSQSLVFFGLLLIIANDVNGGLIQLLGGNSKWDGQRRPGSTETSFAFNGSISATGSASATFRREGFGYPRDKTFNDEDNLLAIGGGEGGRKGGLKLGERVDKTADEELDNYNDSSEYGETNFGGVITSGKESAASLSYGFSHNNGSINEGNETTGGRMFSEGAYTLDDQKAGGSKGSVVGRGEGLVEDRGAASLSYMEFHNQHNFAWPNGSSSDSVVEGRGETMGREVVESGGNSSSNEPGRLNRTEDANKKVRVVHGGESSSYETAPHESSLEGNITENCVNCLVSGVVTKGRSIAYATTQLGSSSNREIISGERSGSVVTAGKNFSADIIVEEGESVGDKGEVAGGYQTTGDNSTALGAEGELKLAGSSTYVNESETDKVVGEAAEIVISDEDIQPIETERHGFSSVAVIAGGSEKGDSRGVISIESGNVGCVGELSGTGILENDVERGINRNRAEVAGSGGSAVTEEGAAGEKRFSNVTEHRDTSAGNGVAIKAEVLGSVGKFSAVDGIGVALTGDCKDENKILSVIANRDIEDEQGIGAARGSSIYEAKHQKSSLGRNISDKVDSASGSVLVGGISTSNNIRHFESSISSLKGEIADKLYNDAFSVLVRRGNKAYEQEKHDLSGGVITTNDTSIRQLLSNREDYNATENNGSLRTSSSAVILRDDVQLVSFNEPINHVFDGENLVFKEDNKYDSALSPAKGSVDIADERGYAGGFKLGGTGIYSDQQNKNCSSRLKSEEYAAESISTYRLRNKYRRSLNDRRLRLIIPRQ